MPLDFMAFRQLSFAQQQTQLRQMSPLELLQLAREGMEHVGQLIDRIPEDILEGLEADLATDQASVGETQLLMARLLSGRPPPPP